MPGTWKSDHLLNLVLVARADGEVTPIEVLFLSRCRTRLGANHLTLADAVMRSYWEDAVKMGGIIADENVLRDMIRMAILDGRTDAAEQDLAMRFVDTSVIPAERVQALIRETFQGLDLEHAGIERDSDRRMGSGPWPFKAQ